MTPEELAAAIRSELIAARTAGELALDDSDVPDSVHVERPRSREHGDWATNIALQLAKKAGVKPRQCAELLATRLREHHGISAVEVAGPGFLNITVEASAAGELARTIVAQGHAYGRTQVNAGKRINLEFVSANPTGPIHIGGTRWAAVGDSLARILAATGADVVREYYFNDHGAQIDRFAASLLARARGQAVPDDGYGGEYIDQIARDVVRVETSQGRPDPTGLPDADAQEAFRRLGVTLMFDEIKQSLHDFGVDFDVYFHEASLHESGAVERAIDRLRHSGNIFENEGALWLSTTDFGDDKDRVVIKSDGEPAYIAGDIAYYLDKRERGFDQIIIMLGADHHGYIGRLQAMCAAFGDTPYETLQILIGQLVNLVRQGEPVRMSKRAGTIVTMEDLVDAVGVDAARYSLSRSSTNTEIDLDLDLLVTASNENPVYYVQYAHARTASIARNAAEHGVQTHDDAGKQLFDPAQLSHPSEAVLLSALGRYPSLVGQAAQLREPHRVARFLEEMASLFHKWYDQCRVTPRGEEPVEPVHSARLWLNNAVRQVLANGLDLLGVSAPDRM